ncbi:MAG: recombinase family protein [Lachnospiraceae bacterium]|nr:recombinase family protein [Lachnospiraceae bacterium]
MIYSKDDVLKVAPVLLPDYKCDFDVSISENLVAETDEDRYYYVIYKKGQKKEIATFLNSHIREALKSLAKTYGYCRISTRKQSIDRQIRNIKSIYPSAVIIQEAYTGMSMDRPEWNRLLKTVKPGERIVFDSVSRMSRSADEGIETYFELYENGIELIFLKEHYIDTEVYAENMRDKIELQGTDEDEIFKGLNNYFRKLASKQIRIAFDQSEKEVQDLRQRTKEGIETARLKGKQIGQHPGKKFNIKKEAPAKEKIIRLSKSFNGTLSDAECMKLAGLSRGTYYKYKRELKQRI